MSLAQPRSAQTGSQARIRILGDPPPTAPGRSPRTLLLACLLAAVVGAGLVFGFRSWHAPGPVAIDAPSVGIGVAGAAERPSGQASRVPGSSPSLASTLQSMLLTDSHRSLPAAARLSAVSGSLTQPPSTKSGLPTRDTPAVTPVTTTTAPTAATSDSGKVARTESPDVGPELPPNPVNPNSQIGSP